HAVRSVYHPRNHLCRASHRIPAEFHWERSGVVRDTSNVDKVVPDPGNGGDDTDRNVRLLENWSLFDMELDERFNVISLGLLHLRRIEPNGFHRFGDRLTIEASRLQQAV